MDIPVWINADIMDSRDSSALRIPVDAKTYFEAAKKLERVTLSIGWTTRKLVEITQCYSLDCVNDMVQSIQGNNISETFPITFPVHAELSTKSTESFQFLYEEISKTNPTTFTIWSYAQDKVDAKKLQEFIELFGVDKVYLDIPDELRNELDLCWAQRNIFE